MSEFGFPSFAAKADLMREAAGEPARQIEINMLVQMAGFGEPRASEIARLTEAHRIEETAWFDSPIVYAVSVEEICAQLWHVREVTGASYFVVFDPVMEAFAPVVEALRNVSTGRGQGGPALNAGMTTVIPCA